MNRRDFLLSAAAGVTIAKAVAHRKLNVSIFSKHLQFLQGEALAKAVAEIGFDGIDLAVRPGGHIEPERVRRTADTVIHEALHLQTSPQWQCSRRKLNEMLT